VLYACALKFKSQAKLLLSTPTQINNSPPLLRPLLDYYILLPRILWCGVSLALARAFPPREAS
jgi:hypothetical protein